MDFTNMNMEQLAARKDDIRGLIEAEDADLDALEAEVRSINEELERRKAAETKRVELRKAVASGGGIVERKFEKEGAKKMTVDEVRSSKAYIDAYANYIKTEDDTECRALLTTNSDVEANPGQVPVPTIVEGFVRTAWQRNGLMDLVSKSYVRGNLQLGFELSADPAVVHEEGTPAPDEEELTLGVITLIPKSIKKWISISDEAMDMGGEEFLYYIYDEITYQIAKKAEDLLISDIVAKTDTASATSVSVPQVSGGAEIGIISEAMGYLSDEADNPVVVMNRQSYAAMKAVQYAANYNIDPFEGLRVLFNNTLPAVGTATTGQTWAIVGDFRVGARANFPNGDQIRLKFDDLSLAESDLVKIVGREYVALGVIADRAFVKIVAE